MPGRKPPLFPDTAQDVHDELAAHIEMRRQELIALGMGEAEARVAAERRFGNVPAIARECRDIDERHLKQRRRARMWTDLRQDVGYAFRLMRRSPAFTLAAVVTLALGLGATTAIFSLANWTLLRPVPGINRPEQLEQIWVGTRRDATSFTPSFLSYPNLSDISTRLQTVAVAGTQGAGALNVAFERQPARPVPGEFVTASYFDVLGVPFAAGRPFTRNEDRPGAAAPVAIVSESLSRALSGSDTGAVGRTLQINGLTFTVVGVPREFEGPHRVRRSSLWLPGASYPDVNHMPAARFEDRTTGGFYELIGRPRDGATVAQIDAELQGVAAWLATEYPNENAKFTTVRFHLLGGIGIDPLVRDRTRTTVTLMLGLSLLVLLIACSNVASLLAMRGLGRRAEVAVRTALGAGRRRLVRQHLAEALVLWLLGGAGALAFVWLVLQVVSGASLLGLRGELGAVPLDWRVATFSLGLALLVGLAFGVVPALRTARVEPGEALKGGFTSSARGTVRIGSVLSTVQLALALMLVLGALLLAGTMRNLARVDVGFDASDVHVFTVRPGAVGYSAAQARQYRDEFERRLRLVPGVQDVALGANLPFFGAYGTRVRAVGSDTILTPSAIQVANPSLFDVLRIPLLEGRTFTGDDLGRSGGATRHVVVLSASLATLLFGSPHAVGRTLEYNTINEQGRIYEVIGIVADIHSRALTGPPEPLIYEAADPDMMKRYPVFAVRTTPGAAIATEVRSIAAALNSALPVANVLPLEEQIAATNAEWGTLASLLGILALLAGVLASVGLYGVVSFAVASRQREFGIRLALGAAPSGVVALVLRRTAVITAIGLALGCGGAVLLTRTLESRLFGITRFDPLVWSAAVLSLVLMALLASLIPARRAVRLDVSATLRNL